jgi:hypothetical protein
MLSFGPIAVQYSIFGMEVPFNTPKCFKCRAYAGFSGQGTKKNPKRADSPSASSPKNSSPIAQPSGSSRFRHVA